MAEYIEREEAKDVMALIVLEAIAHPDTYTCGEAKRAIESIPSADVQPVKHGKWINGLEVPEYERRKHPYVYLNGDTYCSECFAEAYWDTDYGQQLFNYCPNCGADMREES